MEPTKPAKSVKTTAGAILVALGAIISTVIKLVEHGEIGPEDMAMLVTAIGAAWGLWKGRDDDVTSEGMKRET